MPTLWSTSTQVLPPQASNLGRCCGGPENPTGFYAVNRGQNKLFVYFWDGSAHTLTNLITNSPGYLTLNNSSGGTISGTYGLAIDEENNLL